MREIYSIDGTLYRMLDRITGVRGERGAYHYVLHRTQPDGIWRPESDRRIGIMREHKPTKETRKHAESLGIPFGEFRQLSGCVFAFSGPEIEYWQV